MCSIESPDMHTHVCSKFHFFNPLADAHMTPQTTLDPSRSPELLLFLRSARSVHLAGSRRPPLVFLFPPNSSLIH